MLLNIQQHPGQHPTTNNYSAQNVNSAEVEIPCSLPSHRGPQRDGAPDAHSNDLLI